MVTVAHHPQPSLQMRPRLFFFWYLQVPYKAQSSTSHALQNIIILIVTMHTLQCIIFLVFMHHTAYKSTRCLLDLTSLAQALKQGKARAGLGAFLVFSHRELGLPSLFTFSQTNKGIPLDLPIHSRFPMDSVLVGARLLVSSLVLIFFFQTFSFQKSQIWFRIYIYRTQNLVLSPGIKLIQL